jgi:hypothetical protein
MQELNQMLTIAGGLLIARGDRVSIFSWLGARHSFRQVHLAVGATALRDSHRHLAGSIVLDRLHPLGVLSWDDLAHLLPPR